MLTVVRGLQLGRGQVCGGGVQASVVEPVDVFEGGDLDLFDGAPEHPVAREPVERSCVLHYPCSEVERATGIEPA